VPGHQGQFLFGYIAGVPVVCMQGRLHYYEGWDVHDVVLPARIMGLLGAKTLFLTNAAGGLDPAMETPSLMVISDHIMLNFPNPLVGPNIDELGTRFPDMSAVYDPAIRALLKQRGEEMGLPMSEGIYVQLTGPSFETPAEVRFLGSIGGGAVGMSTACEAVAARHMGMRVCGISCITNKGAGISQHALTHEEVVEAGNLIGERFSALVTAVIPEIDAL
jgi:purine-nucleoside phosphorylase